MESREDGYRRTIWEYGYLWTKADALVGNPVRYEEVADLAAGAILKRLARESWKRGNCWKR
ncbi:hypothetical protein M427DRAFT_59810 [Gonapodya prolifera JEL478]|uniref:Uncharacterized protein n=1 Tax=Gonapodya prolifera (strain JEL478) TaxID=1344416 RepID=A0A139A707_GONPJ|nr:hypothetical protein M427DRAFT_59810 [Gonapodya prolifera JEL478]|eukprot:KXS12123.1 hypothetical protein M427DRAFT_59810 [Gonapodya prolifera JEL478]